MFGSKDPFLGIRVALSLLRDSLPWLYDEGCALLPKLQNAKTPTARKRALREFHDLIMMSTRNPYVEKYLVDNEDDYILVREVPQMIMHALERYCDVPS